MMTVVDAVTPEMLVANVGMQVRNAVTPKTLAVDKETPGAVVVVLLLHVQELAQPHWHSAGVVTAQSPLASAPPSFPPSPPAPARPLLLRR